MTQSIEEFLVKIGVDSSQASKINDVINVLTNLANSANSTAQELTQSISKTGNASDKAMANIEKGADKAKSKVSILKAAFIGFVAGAILYGNKIASAFNNAIANAGNLLNSKNTLFKASQTELIQARQYQREMDRTKLSISSVATKIALNLAPNLTRAANGFNNWLSSNKELVANGITAVVKALGWVIQLIVNVSRFINKIITSTIGWKNALIGLAVVWAAFNTALLFSPLGIIIGLVIALALAIDDLMVYLDGGQSAFGEYWQPLIDGAKKLWEYIQLYWGLIKAIWSGDSEQIKSYGKKLFDSLVGLFTGFYNTVKSILSSILKSILTFFGMSEKNANKTVSRIGKIFSFIYDLITAPFRLAYKAIVSIMDYLGIDAGDVVNAVASAFSAVFDLVSAPFKALFNFISDLFDIWEDDSTSVIDKIFASFESFKDNILSVFSAIGDFIIAPFKFAIDWINDKFFSVIDKVKNGVGSVLSFFGITGDSEDKIKNLELSSSTPSVAGNQMTTTTNSNQQSVNYDVKVEQSISTSDPTTAANQSASGISDAINQASASSKTAFAI